MYFLKNWTIKSIDNQKNSAKIYDVSVILISLNNVYELNFLHQPKNLIWGLKYRNCSAAVAIKIGIQKRLEKSERDTHGPQKSRRIACYFMQ